MDGKEKLLEFFFTYSRVPQSMDKNDFFPQSSKCYEVVSAGKDLSGMVLKGARATMGIHFGFVTCIYAYVFNHVIIA